MKNVLESAGGGPISDKIRPVGQVNINDAIVRACGRISPLWPLKSFVAVNPFLGFSEMSFHATCATFRRVNRVDVLMPRGFYKQSLDSKVIEEQDLRKALSSAPSSWPIPKSVEEFRRRLEKVSPSDKPRARVATISEVLDRLASGNKQASRTAFMIDEISKFCAAYYDEGQSILPFPFKGRSLYPAWRESQRFDRNPAMMGLKHFQRAIADLPENPVESIRFVIRELGIPARAVDEYLYRALFDINGWASYVRHLVWKHELNGVKDSSLVELLAIRVVWGYGLFLERTDRDFANAWKAAMEEAALLPDDSDLSYDSELAIDMILHEAYERAHQRKLFSSLAQASNANQALVEKKTPQFKVAFCIDVRSEVFRRALESVSPSVETIGVASFFGVPIEFEPMGAEKGREQCPVLLKPHFRILEGPRGSDDHFRQKLVESRVLNRNTSKVWKRFKQSAVSCFAYVEALGVFALGDLLKNSLRFSRKPELSATVPLLEARIVNGQASGFIDIQKINVAKSLLKAMSLTTQFPQIVLLLGHGSSTVNNPHASGLDCGACGGQSGAVNARIAAGILNDPIVREALGKEGIFIPERTWFLGGLHNTTTDEVQIFDDDLMPKSVVSEVLEFRTNLAKASHLARLERSVLLGLKNEVDPKSKIFARSCDWSQVRPEWGLAGNSAFIVGPRSLTAKACFEGSAFLHSYNWKADPDISVLESIMTAPMIVASWINLQYFASTTNNPVFGAGNKVLHNVSGTIGVLEGNGGDLRVGLPWQSVHDGINFVHKPLRLNVFIASPIDRINDVIRKHPSVRNLLDNRWVHLFAQDDEGRISGKYVGNLNWE